MQLLADAPVARSYRHRAASLLALIDAYDYEVEVFRRLSAEELADHGGTARSRRSCGWD